jgi:hypothetical protein
VFKRLNVAHTKQQQQPKAVAKAQAKKTAVQSCCSVLAKNVVFRESPQMPTAVVIERRNQIPTGITDFWSYASHDHVSSRLW